MSWIFYVTRELPLTKRMQTSLRPALNSTGFGPRRRGNHDDERQVEIHQAMSRSSSVSLTTHSPSVRSALAAKISTTSRSRPARHLFRIGIDEPRRHVRRRHRYEVHRRVNIDSRRVTIRHRQIPHLLRRAKLLA